MQIVGKYENYAIGYNETERTSNLPARNEWKTNRRVETAIDRQTLIRIDERETLRLVTATTAGSWLTTNWTSVFRAPIIEHGPQTRNGQQAKVS